MSGWADAAMAAVLLTAAAARAANVTPLRSDPARRWLVATLTALGSGTLLHAVLAAGVASTPQQRGILLWLSDVATMIAAACMVGVVAPDRERDPHTSRLCAHAMVVAAVALVMAAQLQVAAADLSAIDQHADPLHYLLPYLSYLLLALVGTVHGLRQQPPRLCRLRKPAITVAIIGGAVAGIVGTASQRLSAVADPPLLFALPRFTHVGIVLEIAGHAVLVAGLAATPIIQARRAFRRRRQYRALEPLWHIVTDAALHAGHLSQASTAASAVKGHRVDLLYRRVIEICDACHALTRYARYPDPLGLQRGHLARPEPETAAALLNHAILASHEGQPPRDEIPISASVPDHNTVEELATWLIAVVTILTDGDRDPSAHPADR